MPRITEHQVNQVFSTADAIDDEKHVIVHYCITPCEGSSIDEVAATLAINTSMGTTTPLSIEKEVGLPRFNGHN
ncbi:hypothetical protein [Longilinea arvoryzae]|uniref:hypothetical protein n=1 Tax=Longilinea arvoryzae TaxID=360412 RepID=UPI000946718B|nr:hypothetical protein [Longilinea arvoryzae]